MAFLFLLKSISWGKGRSLRTVEKVWHCPPEREQVTGNVTGLEGHSSGPIGVSGHETDAGAIGMREFLSGCTHWRCRSCGVKDMDIVMTGYCQACTTKQEDHERWGLGTKDWVFTSLTKLRIHRECVRSEYVRVNWEVERVERESKYGLGSGGRIIAAEIPEGKSELVIREWKD